MRKILKWKYEKQTEIKSELKSEKALFKYYSMIIEMLKMR